MNSTLKASKITFCDLSINYVEKGSGPPMIFLHNGGGFWNSWEHQLHYFSKTHTVFGIDWPGFGESEAPDGLITLDLLTEVLTQFIEEKKLSDLTLVGNCIGGSAALNYCKTHANNVKNLIIFNICPGSLIYPIRILRKLLPALNNKPMLKSIVQALFVFSFTKTPVRHKFPRILFGRHYDPESGLSKKYIEKFKLASQTASRVNLVFSVHTFNIEAYMTDEIAHKHLMVWGSHNTITNLKNHGYYHYHYLKSDEFVIIQDGGHLCMYEKPDEVNALIEAYVLKSEKESEKESESGE
jgi:pimeloyl-ACP methyl ester carboxylesterase